LDGIHDNMMKEKENKRKGRMGDVVEINP